jgi:Icc-related predicted phosphoesterase
MKCLVFSDIHSNHRALERLMDVEADYYFAAGDMVSWERGLDRCGEILKRRAGQVYVLPGNHESAGQISAFCRRYGFHDFHEQSIEASGYHIAGLGYSSPTPFNTPGEFTEEEIALRLKRFAGLKPLILICHCPPYGTALDQVRDGVHAGSHSVREFIEKNQPRFFFCGHIHEAEGVSVEIGGTRAFNVGSRGYLFDSDKLQV